MKLHKRFLLLLLWCSTINIISAQRNNSNALLGAHGQGGNRLTRDFGGNSSGTIILFTHFDKGRVAFTVTNNETKQSWSGTDTVFVKDTTAKPDCGWHGVLTFNLPAGDYTVSSSDGSCAWDRFHLNAGGCQQLEYSHCALNQNPGSTTTVTTPSNQSSYNSTSNIGNSNNNKSISTSNNYNNQSATTSSSSANSPQDVNCLSMQEVINQHGSSYITTSVPVAGMQCTALIYTKDLHSYPPSKVYDSFIFNPSGIQISWIHKEPINLDGDLRGSWYKWIKYCVSNGFTKIGDNEWQGKNNSVIIQISEENVDGIDSVTVIFTFKCV